MSDKPEERPEATDLTVHDLIMEYTPAQMRLRGKDWPVQKAAAEVAEWYDLDIDQPPASTADLKYPKFADHVDPQGDQVIEKDGVKYYRDEEGRLVADIS